MGPATLGATRHLTELELENASCRAHLRGAGLEPPWRGQPRENLLLPERSVSSASRVRGPAGIGGWARGCDSKPLNQPPLPVEQRPRTWEGSRGGIQAVWADPGSPLTPGLGKMGSDTAAPRWPDCSESLAAFRLESCFPGSLGFGAGSGGWSNTLLSPGSARGRARVCVYVSVCLTLCVRAVAWPARTLPGSRPAGAPFATGSIASLPRLVNVVPSGPCRVHSCGVGTGRVHIWTRGHVLLTAVFRLERSLCSSCGGFSVTTCEQFFKVRE